MVLGKIKKYICEECGEIFTDYVSNKRKYCSKICKKLNKNEEVFCLECHDKFIAYKSLNKKFCSKVCRYSFSHKHHIPWNKGKKGVMPVPWNKGKGGYKIHSEEHKKALSKKFKGRVSPMKGRKHSDETKKEMSRARKGMKWSKESKERFSEQQKGKNNPMYGKTHGRKYKERLKIEFSGNNNPNWKGGVTPENKARISTAKWKNIRLKVYKRDNWACQSCGIKCSNAKKLSWKTIQCHHLIAWRDGGSDELENLTTLCVRCHAKIEYGLREKKAWEYL